MQSRVLTYVLNGLKSNINTLCLSAYIYTYIYPRYVCTLEVEAYDDSLALMSIYFKAMPQGSA